MGDERKFKQIIKKLLVTALSHAIGNTITATISFVIDGQQRKVFLCFDLLDGQSTLFPYFEMSGSSNQIAATNRQNKIMKELTIPKMLVELMNGEIGLSLKQNFHCWFRIGLIPTNNGHIMDQASSIQLGSQVPMEPKAPAEKSYFQILVVEDNLVNLKIVCKLLSHQQFPLQIDTATNGQMGLEMMMKTRYDMVFMDCQMPIMDGFESVKLYREYEGKVLKGYKIPIIACTAQGLSSEQQRCFDVGMNGLITKPLKPADLEKVLKMYLKR